MKTFNKEELKAVAADVFKRYPKAQKVAVTADGTAFITDESENAVKNHSKKNASGKELSITPFTRDEIEGTAASQSTKAEDLIAAINAATTVAEVDAILATEIAGKKRKTVLDAAEVKLTELKKA